MKYEKFEDTGGTYLQGHIDTTYENIVSVLGKQHHNGDDYKTDAEWNIKFEDGTIATLYNWKNGKNYCRDEGLDIEDITEWNIGGHSPRARDLLFSLLNKSDHTFLESLEDVVGQFQMKKIDQKQVIQTLKNLIEFYE
tara:strand:+ start:930 stop:1343 length:414 start_codon:yes stop_codon:yes gene_type:complete